MSKKILIWRALRRGHSFEKMALSFFGRSRSTIQKKTTTKNKQAKPVKISLIEANLILFLVSQKKFLPTLNCQVTLKVSPKNISV